MVQHWLKEKREKKRGKRGKGRKKREKKKKLSRREFVCVYGCLWQQGLGLFRKKA